MNEQKAMKAYKALHSMESAADLKKAGFTLADFHDAWDALQTYVKNNGEDGATTISKSVAGWYTKQGFDVQPEGIGWRIR